MKHSLWVLALVAACANAGRYDSIEKQNAKQEFCRKAGDLAVAAREHPDLARQRMAENVRDNSPLSKAWNDAMSRGLQAGPEIADRDLYMRGWSACMDTMRSY